MLSTIRISAAVTAAALVVPAVAQAGDDSSSYADTVLSSGPAMYLRMGDTALGEAQDSVVPARTSVAPRYVGAATFGIAGPFKDAGDAVAFAAVGRVEATLPVRTSAVELWVKPQKLGRTETAGLVSHGGANDGWALGIVKRKLVLHAGGRLINTRASLPTGQWTAVVVSWADNGVLKVYANGVPAGRGRLHVGPPLPESAGGAVEIAGTGASRFAPGFAGALDEVALYDHPLSESDARAHFALSHLPLNVAKPVISGEPLEGQTLTVSDGAWAAPETLTTVRQWQICDANGDDCEDVAGATESELVLPQGAAGHTFQVAETAHNAVGDATVYSDPTGVVAAAPGAGDGGGDPGTGTPGDGTGTPVAGSGSAQPQPDAGASPAAVAATTGAGAVAGTAAHRCVKVRSARRVTRRRGVGIVRLTWKRGRCLPKSGLRAAFKPSKRGAVELIRYRVGRAAWRTDRRRPYAMTLKRTALKPGRRTLVVRVRPRSGRTRTVKVVVRLKAA